MANLKLWLYCPFFMATWSFCLHPADATIIAWRSYGTAGSQDEYNACMEVLDGYCPEYSGSQEARDICNNIVSDITEGCSSSDQGDLYNILEFSGHTFDCHNTTAIVHRLHSCNACLPRDGGWEKRPVQLQLLCGNLVSWSWENADTDVELMLEWWTGDASCGDGSVPSDLNVCVECPPETDNTWVVDSGYRMKSGIKLCGQYDPSVSTYGCARNSYLYGYPRTGSTIDCRACPQYASCTLTDGHTNSFTCPSGMIKDTDSYYASICGCPRGKYMNSGTCTDCPANTFSDIYANIYGVNSCDACPMICDVQSTTDGATGATSVAQCCVHAGDGGVNELGSWMLRYGVCGS